MAQQTNDQWKAFLKMSGTMREYAFDFGGTWYGPEAVIEHKFTRNLYEQFGFGNASCSQLELSLYSKEPIVRSEKIKCYVRLVNGKDASDYLPAGVFFVNHRSVDGNYCKIEAFDVMRKADMPWNPSPSLHFPLSMPDAAAEFALIMGCEIDPRTQLNQSYTISYPTSDPDNENGENYTIRQELQWIAAAHGGNWIVTAEGKLLLVPLGGEPEETNYLVTEHGKPIQIGKVVLLVG